MEGPGSGSSESLGSTKFGQTIRGAGTLGDGAGTAEGIKVNLRDGGVATRRTCGARSGAGGSQMMAW